MATRLASTVDWTKTHEDENQAKAYAAARPVYPDALFRSISEHCQESTPDMNLAVDVGCGTGNSTLGFAKYFKKVIGADVSAAQIAHAPKNIPNVDFRVGPSDKLPFIEDESVDLFCAATSFHFMPRDATFAEADRVLRPGGTLAIFGYTHINFQDPGVQRVNDEWWLKTAHYLPGVSLETREEGIFKDLELPYAGWVRKPTIIQRTKVTIEDVMLLCKSNWPIVAFDKDHPDEDILGQIRSRMTEEMMKAYGEPIAYTVIQNHLAVARKPMNN